MKKDCSPSKLARYKGLRQPTCGCAACWKKYTQACVARYPIIGSDTALEWDEAMFGAGEFFWFRFSQLVGETLALVHPAMRSELLMQLGDKTSVYSVAT